MFIIQQSSFKENIHTHASALLRGGINSFQRYQTALPSVYSNVAAYIQYIHIHSTTIAMPRMRRLWVVGLGSNDYLRLTLAREAYKGKREKPIQSFFWNTKRRKSRETFCGDRKRLLSRQMNNMSAAIPPNILTTIEHLPSLSLSYICHFHILTFGPFPILISDIFMLSDVYFPSPSRLLLH